jgi:hypothetical protein
MDTLCLWRVSFVLSVTMKSTMFSVAQMSVAMLNVDL